jgi:hypothetical protein
MRLGFGSTKREVCARRDEVSMRPNTTSLHALRYYSGALSLGLKRSKLWVKALLHLESSTVSLGWRLYFVPDSAYCKSVWNDNS